MATNFFDPAYLENCYAALLAQLQTAVFPAAVPPMTFSRNLVPPDEVPVVNQPALILVPGPIHVEQTHFALSKWTFTAIALIYMRADMTLPTPTPLPATLANYVLWGLMNSLMLESTPVPNYDKQTLGGLVTNCWMEGEVHMEVSASNGGQLIMGIPIFMLAGNVA